MTPLQTKVLAHLIYMAQTQKAYAWSAAKWYADTSDELAELPQMLTAAMLSGDKT